jgi:hypothetical protein
MIHRRKTCVRTGNIFLSRYHAFGPLVGTRIVNNVMDDIVRVRVENTDFLPFISKSDAIRTWLEHTRGVYRDTAAASEEPFMAT